jgi:hypothetical protein
VSLDAEAKEKLSRVSTDIVKIALTIENNKLMQDVPQGDIEHADNIYTTILSTDQTTERTVQRQVRTHINHRYAAARAVPPDPTCLPLLLMQLATAGTPSMEHLRTADRKPATDLRNDTLRLCTEYLELVS